MDELKQAIGKFINDHPWMTYWIISAVVSAPAAIIRAIKWNGKNGYTTEQLKTVVAELTKEMQKAEEA